MPKLISALTIALAATTAAGTAADAASPFDFAALTCNEFLRATGAGQEAITLWLDGYYSSNPTEHRVELSEILQKVPALRTACEESRDAKIAGIFQLQEGLSATSRTAGND